MTAARSGVLGPARAARRASTSKSYRAAAHVGLAARGLLYLVLGGLSFDVALHGSSPAPTDAQGALQEVGRQSAGPALLTAVAVGLGGYALWRVLQVLSGRGDAGRHAGAGRRLGWFGIAVVYGALCAEAVQLATARSSTAGPSSSGSSGSGSSGSVNNPEPWAAHVLRWPGGPELLGLAGAAVVVAGGALALWGVFHDHNKELRLDAISPARRRLVRVLGGVGNGARGFLVALVGVYLLDAAAVSDAAKAKSLDAALRSLSTHEYGAVLIGAAAAGLLCFGLYSFCEARLRRL